MYTGSRYAMLINGRVHHQCSACYTMSPVQLILPHGDIEAGVFHTHCGHAEHGQWLFDICADLAQEAHDGKS